MLGVVESFSPAWVSDVMQAAVVAVVPAALIWAANTAMLGLSRHVYVLATNRQIPSWLGKLNRRFRTPHVAILGAAIAAIALIIPADVALLGGLFAFGATIAFTIAHLSVIRMRITDPERERPFRIPFDVTMFGARVPLPTVVAAILTALAWVSVIIYHDTARWVGGGWMVFGLVSYVIYRKGIEGTTLTERVEVPAEALVKGQVAVESGDILVPVFGTNLDDDIVGTAGRLADAAERPGELAPRLEVDLRARPAAHRAARLAAAAGSRRRGQRGAGARQAGGGGVRDGRGSPVGGPGSFGRWRDRRGRPRPRGRDDRHGGRAPDPDPRRRGARRNRRLAAGRDRAGDRVRAAPRSLPGAGDRPRHRRLARAPGPDRAPPRPRS